MEKLVFTTAGIPLETKPRKYPNAFEDIQKMGLGGMEVEFVRGVNMNPQTQSEVRELISENGLVLTAHGPYYINLNAAEQEKIDASITRVLDTARVAHNFGGYSITFHAAFYLKQDPELVYENVKKQFKIITDTLKKEEVDIWVRPETTGKGTQWGDLDEVIRISKEFDKVLPCVDFSHLHARSVGEFNTYDEFAMVFDRIGNEIGQYALDNFHAHLAGIEYGPKGEKRHLMLEESDMNYKDLLKAFKDFGVKGAVVCESPDMASDAMLLNEYYNSL